MRRLLLASPILVFAIACENGGGSTIPTTPSVAPPAIITPTTSIYIGQSVTFNAISSGTIRWGGDAPSVATVDQATGRVTAVNTGRVTIWAENAGGRTTRLLRGLPSFAGTWTGELQAQACAQSGAYVCSSEDLGTTNVRLLLSQMDDTVEAGSITLGGGWVGTTTATTVGEDGAIRLPAAMAMQPDPYGVSTSVENIALNSPTPGTIQGTLEVVYTRADIPGQLRLFQIVNLTRGSGGPAFGAAPPTR
jgi:Big-like domain-containing protein